MADKLGIPIAIILAALIVATAIAFSLRWEFTVTEGTPYRVDRWTGTIAVCLQDEMSRFHCSAAWGSAAPKK
jgi:hypothetical protein